MVSNDISEGLGSLQTFGVIGELNPTYKKIMIYLTNNEATTILNKCDKPVRETMLDLASII